MKDKSGEALRNIRKIFGLTRIEMGEYLEVSKSTIEKYETDQISIPHKKRKMLTKDLFLSLEQLDNNTIPGSLDLSKVNISCVPKIFVVLYPIIIPDSPIATNSFQEAFTWHAKLRDEILLEKQGNNDITLHDYLEEMRRCKHNYMMATKEDKRMFPYSATNLISLCLLYATIVHSFFPQEDNLYTFSLKKQIRIDGFDNSNPVLKISNPEELLNELHREFVYQHLQTYLQKMKETVELTELEAYFSACLYQAGLVSTQFSMEESIKIYKKQYNKLVRANNKYALRSLAFVCDLYHIDQ